MRQNEQEKISKIFWDVALIRSDNSMDTPAQLQNRIRNAILHGNIKIFKNEKDEPIGYVIWAGVKRETLNYMSKTQRLPSFSCEWSEGKIKVFFDVVLSNKWRVLALYHFKMFLRKHRFFAYYRKNKLKICRNTYPRVNGYFWHYKLVDPKRTNIFKSLRQTDAGANNITSIKYINLDKDFEKRFLLNKLLSKFTYPLERIPGVLVDSKFSSAEKYMKYGLQSYVKEVKESRQRGVLGCWVAHAKALESIIETEGITVVLEDDFVCRDGFFERALKMIENFDKDFDVIMFDPEGTGPLDHHAIGSGMYETEGYTYPEYHGSHCLFYNNKSVHRILETMLNSFVRDFDGFLLIEQTIKAYVFYTGEAKSLFFSSDVNGVRSETSLWDGIGSWIDFVCEWESNEDGNGAAV